MITLIKTLFLSGLLSASLLKLYAQTKPIEFDWAKKDTIQNIPRFPFDEIFLLKIINLKDVKKFDIKITDITDSKEIFPIKNVRVEASGTYSEQIGPLLPNHNFKIELLSAVENRNLNDDEKKHLVDKITNDLAFNEQLRSVFYTTDYGKIKLDDFKKLFEGYLIKNEFDNYQVHYGKIETQAYLQANLANAQKPLIDLATKLNQTNKNLKYIFQGKENEIDSLFSNLYEPHSDSNYYLKFQDSETFQSYIERTHLNTLPERFKKELKDEIAKKKVGVAVDFILKNSIENFDDNFKELETNLQKWLNGTLSKTIVENVIEIKIIGTTDFDNNTEAAIYTSQTFGYGYSPNTGNGLSYFSFSFFVRPVNNSIPLSHVKGKEWWKVRFCANVGLTLEDIKTNKNGTISGLGSIFGDKAGLLGIGFRPWSFLKIDANSIFYYLQNPNPLIDNKKLVASPFFGVSVNLNVVKLLSGQPNSLTTLQNNNNNTQNP